MLYIVLAACEWHARETRGRLVRHELMAFKSKTIIIIITIIVNI